MDSKPRLYLVISSRDGVYNDRIQRIAQQAGWHVVFPSDRARKRGSSEYIVEESLTCQNGLVVWSQASVHSRFLRRVARRLAAQGRGIAILFEDVKPPAECKLVREMVGDDSAEFWRELEDSLRYESQQDFSPLVEDAEPSASKSAKSSKKSRDHSGSNHDTSRRNNPAKKSRAIGKLMPWVVIITMGAALYTFDWLASGRLHELALEQSTLGYPELFPEAKQAGGKSKPVIIEY